MHYGRAYYSKPSAKACASCWGCLMASLAVPVGMQVIARYTGIIPVFLWTEELATFIFVWVVMIGSMVAVWDGTHFDVVVTPDAQSPLGKLIQKEHRPHLCWRLCLPVRVVRDRIRQGRLDPNFCHDASQICCGSTLLSQSLEWCGPYSRRTAFMRR